MSLLANDKITEIFCSADKFCKEFAQMIKENRRLAIKDGKKHLSSIFICTISGFI
jgi:hypothetical protein